MTKMQKFLIQNVGFHFEDFSLSRQLELETIQQELGVSSDWILLALSKDTLSKWEEWGFALFRKPEFKNGIDASLQALKKVPEDRLDKELNKGKPEFRGYEVIELHLTKEEYINRFGKNISNNCSLGEGHFLLHYPPQMGEIQPTLYNCFIEKKVDQQ